MDEFNLIAKSSIRTKIYDTDDQFLTRARLCGPIVRKETSYSVDNYVVTMTPTMDAYVVGFE